MTDSSNQASNTQANDNPFFRPQGVDPTQPVVSNDPLVSTAPANISSGYASISQPPPMPEPVPITTVPVVDPIQTPAVPDPIAPVEIPAATTSELNMSAPVVNDTATPVTMPNEPIMPEKTADTFVMPEIPSPVEAAQPVVDGLGALPTIESPSISVADEPKVMPGVVSEISKAPETAKVLDPMPTIAEPVVNTLPDLNTMMGQESVSAPVMPSLPEVPAPEMTIPQPVMPTLPEIPSMQSETVSEAPAALPPLQSEVNTIMPASDTLPEVNPSIPSETPVTPLAQEIPAQSEVPLVAAVQEAPAKIEAEPVKTATGETPAPASKMKNLVLLLGVLVVGIMALVLGIIVASTQ